MDAGVYRAEYGEDLVDFRMRRVEGDAGYVSFETSPNTYDNEPETVALMDAYILQNGYENDFGKDRLHHEIYLSDPRKSTSDKMRTVIRHPVRKR